MRAPNVFATPHMEIPGTTTPTMTELDVRGFPPSERHGRIHDAFAELAAGECVPEHEHPDRTVLVHVLEGAVDVALDGDSNPVEAGEILRFEGESAVEPAAREDSVALVVLAPRAEA